MRTFLWTSQKSWTLNDLRFEIPQSEINALEFCIKWTFEKWVCENLFRLSAQCNSETEAFPYQKIKHWNFEVSFYLHWGSEICTNPFYWLFLMWLEHYLLEINVMTDCHWNSAFCTTYNNQLPHFEMIRPGNDLRNN